MPLKPGSFPKNTKESDRSTDEAQRVTSYTLAVFAKGSKKVIKNSA